MDQLLKEKNDSSLTIKETIAPIDLDMFKLNYFEQKELFIQRNNSKYYQNLFSIENVDEILDRHRPSGNSLRVVKNQDPDRKSVV